MRFWCRRCRRHDVSGGKHKVVRTALYEQRQKRRRNDGDHRKPYCAFEHFQSGQHTAHCVGDCRPTTGTPLLSRNFPVFSASVSALCANIPCRPMSAPNTVAQNVSSHFVHRHTEAVNCERSSVLPTAAVAFSASSTRVSGSPTLHRISAITIAAPKKSHCTAPRRLPVRRLSAQKRTPEQKK